MGRRRALTDWLFRHSLCLAHPHTPVSRGARHAAVRLLIVVVVIVFILFVLSARRQVRVQLEHILERLALCSVSDVMTNMWTMHAHRFAIHSEKGIHVHTAQQKSVRQQHTNKHHALPRSLTHLVSVAPHSLGPAVEGVGGKNHAYEDHECIGGVEAEEVLVDADHQRVIRAALELCLRLAVPVSACEKRS
jgi:hypothetical protein